MTQENENVKVSNVICGIFDVKTTTITTTDVAARAFPFLFIVNDLWKIKDNLLDYCPDINDNILYFRTVEDIIKHFETYIYDGQAEKYLPIICVYDLLAKIKPLMYILSQKYYLDAKAQTSTNVYTIDICEKETHKKLLRFWDVSHLEKNGLKYMGDICNLPQIGIIDNKIRTNKTPLTEQEIEIINRDVQIIPQYLLYLCEINKWLKPEYFGTKIITKTSLVRQMARYKIGNHTKFIKQNGKKFGVFEAFKRTATQEFPISFQQYALRKSCFRGGFSFISADWASQTLKNVISLDVNSMHHLFINGMYIPTKFKAANCEKLEAICWEIINTPVEKILEYYYKPFLYGIHARVDFTNLRLKENSTFDRNQIGLISEDRFNKFFTQQNPTQNKNDLHNNAAEENLRWQGWIDKAIKAQFAYGKLMFAEHLSIHVNEFELWNIAQVYDFDDLNVRLGEYSTNFILPPDYVSLQSNILYKEKQAMKTVLKNYKENRYNENVPEDLPKNMRNKIIGGTVSRNYLEDYYVHTTKSMFNSIYGTQAMDLLRPGWEVLDGDLFLDKDSFVDEQNFDEKKPENINVFYNYGMRISSRSRTHLIIALILFDKYQLDLEPVSGDTDSLKMVVFTDISDKKILEIIEPLQKAATFSLEFCQQRIKQNYPELAADLSEIGLFEIEKNGAGKTRYAFHFEAWQKARLSLVFDNENEPIFKFVCAGLSRPENKFTIFDWIKTVYKNGVSFDKIANIVLGYNTFFEPEITHSLMLQNPAARNVVKEKVTDYLGNKSIVFMPETISYIPSGITLSDLATRGNQTNIYWQQNMNNRVFDLLEKIVSFRDNMAVFEFVDNETGEIFTEEYSIMV